MKDQKPMILLLMETRTSTLKASRILNSFHFSKMAAVEASGFRGGIWCFWDSSQVNIEVINFDFQFMNLGILSGTKVLWMMTVIYASPEKQTRQQLWISLRRMGQLIEVPWVIIGDCNEVLTQDDKCGGKRVHQQGNQELGRLISKCGLIDLGYLGPQYTWTNSKEDNNRSAERLDRVWANRDWKLMFVDAYVQHLMRTHSDYHPLYLTLTKEARKKGPCLGRYQLAWAKHPDFPKFVQET